MIKRKRLPNRYLLRQDTPLMSRRRAWPHVGFMSNKSETWAMPNSAAEWRYLAANLKRLEANIWCSTVMPDQFVEFNGEFWFANDELAVAFMLRWT
jgi:hypothetical protein